MRLPMIDWSEMSLQVVITFGHFLWQGVVVAVLLAMVQQLISSNWQSTIGRKPRSGQRDSRRAKAMPLRSDRFSMLRYIVACIAFFSLPGCVVSTFLWVHHARGPIRLAASDLVLDTAPIAASVHPEAAQTSGELAAAPSSRVQPEQDSPRAQPLRQGADERVLAAPWATLTHRIQPFAPHVCLAYLVGVTGMFTRFGVSLLGGARLRRTLLPITDVQVLEIVTTQAARLGLRRTPLVALCRRIPVPAVVGVLRPTILLPPALLCGLDPLQLAAILSHELAHVRRYDPIVNLLQRIVEALLFFHPATWWISHRVRIERENCCDDAAAGSAGRLQYSGALLQMAELCLASDRRRLSALASLSADGGNTSDLAQRVRRLIDAEETPRVGVTFRSLAIGLAILSLLAMSLVSWERSLESAEKPAADAAESAIFKPDPLWQTALGADDAADPLARVSPIVVAKDRVLSVDSDFELQTGQPIARPFVRLPRIGEYDVSLYTVLRRKSSDRAFWVEVSVRSPGRTSSEPSYDLRVLRTSDGTQTGKTIHVPDIFDPHTCQVDVENGGHFVLLGDRAGVRVYRIETGQVETTMPVETKRVDAVAFCPDREWLVASDQNDLHFWRWRDQRPVKTIHAGRKIDCLTFTPDGQYLAEGPDTREDIQIRDMRTLEIVASLRDEVGSPLMVSSMDITPDGRYLVAHNEVSVGPTKLNIPHRVHVWDLRNRQLAFQIATGEWCRKVAFSDDGGMIIGEFSGAAHGSLLAAWNLPEVLISRRVDSPSDIQDRLGDGIQWSTSGDLDGLLSGARLVLPSGGLKPGEPLVVEYRLANVSRETKSLTCFLNKGMLLPTLSRENRISGVRLDWHREPVTLTIEPGQVFIDSDHRVSIDTTGLEPGEYQVALGSAFRFPDATDANITHAIPHGGSLPFAIIGESTIHTRELPKSDIHWGEPVAGLRLGARFAGDPNAFSIGDTVGADLFVANGTDRPIACSVVLPHPQDGWRFNVEDRDGHTIMLERPIPISTMFPQRYVHLELAPGEMAPITGDGISVSFSSSPADEASAGSLPRATFRIVGSKEEAEQPWEGDRVHRVQGRLVSQGGRYSAIYDVTLLRPDIPSWRVQIDSGNVPFTIPGVKDQSR